MLKMKLGTKIISLVVGFALALLLIAVVGWIGMQGMVERFAKADEANNMYKNLLEARRHEKNFIIRLENKWKEAAESALGDIKKQARDLKVKFRDQLNKQQIDGSLAAIADYEKALSHLGEWVNNKKTSKTQDHDKEIEATIDCRTSGYVWPSETESDTNASSYGVLGYCGNGRATRWS